MDWDLHNINQLSVYSILLPFVTALIRFRSISNGYYPFLLLIGLGVLNEAIGTLIIRNGGQNTIPLNIYCLLAAAFIVWQFHNWKLFPSPTIAASLLIFFVVLWALEVFIIFAIDRFCSYFIITSSFAITVLSIFMINRLIVRETRQLIKQPEFIISVAFVIYFAYSLIVECFMLRSGGDDVPLQVRIYHIFDITNIFTNLLYTLAIVWMPTRQRFTLPY